MKARIAILDDEARMADILSIVLRREGYEVESFSQPELAVEALLERPFDLLITDLRMPGMDGLEVMRRVREQEPELPVILITAHGSVPSALSALKEGAFDYVEKPFDNEELKSLARRALEVTRLGRENRYLRAELASRYALDDVVAESEGMKAVLELARRAARSRATVLVTGESGTGKELIARAVHYHSDRVGQPFLAVNCKALAEGVLESELFGHERGAFTGAERSRPGLFERASGGTVFLDEIGEVSADFQAKLLRVLQERRVRRVGGDDESEVDVRVVAATNRDLKAEVAAGRFREDLYFRLAVVPIAIPSLRERPEDVLPLARHVLVRTASELGRPGLHFGTGVEDALASHPWPGNVRELENAVERGAVLARSDEIALEDLLLDGPGASGEPAPTDDESLTGHLDRATAAHIRKVLERSGGRRAVAAGRMGVDRTTLYRLMRKFGIE